MLIEPQTNFLMIGGSITDCERGIPVGEAFQVGINDVWRQFDMPLQPEIQSFPKTTKPVTKLTELFCAK